jgi:hypothetical protein
MQIDKQKPEIIRTPEIPEAPIKNHSPLFRRIDFTEESVGFQGGSQKRSGIKLALWTWLSASVDALILTSLSCFFILTFSFLMKTEASILFKSLFQSIQLYQVTMVSFVGSFWLYLVFMRVFSGATLGEMTCSLRLGQPLQRRQSTYILKVIFRTSLIILTGIFLLPLISLVLKRDIAGEISGLKIYSLI